MLVYIYILTLCVYIYYIYRFQYNTYSRGKITCLVDFPIKGLDISNYFTPSSSSNASVDLTYWKLLGMFIFNRARYVSVSMRL